MKITVGELRRIIAEEVTRTLSEGGGQYTYEELERMPVVTSWLRHVRTDEGLAAAWDEIVSAFDSGDTNTREVAEKIADKFDISRGSVSSALRNLKDVKGPLPTGDDLVRAVEEWRKARAEYASKNPMPKTDFSAEDIQYGRKEPGVGGKLGT